MTLISLLLVLLVERVTTKSRYWQADLYTNKYIQMVESKNGLDSSSKSWALGLIICIPPIIVYLVVHELAGGLIEFIFSTAVLMVCVGCPAIRETYKCFLQAANKGDLQSCNMYQQQINENDTEQYSFGLNLVWQNYRHYTAVILWFVILGAAGSILYILVRDLAEKLSNNNDQGAEQAIGLLKILDWLPVRITALGMLVVGHFSRAFPVWLGYLPDPVVPAKTLLLNVAKQAEDIEPDESNCADEPCTLVRLAKRNVMFLLVVIAILTLSGLTS